MKIVTILGARPQFIKAAAVSRAIAAHNAAGGRPLSEVIVHTGQHFDHNMSEVFFEELGIPAPDHRLGISGGGHGAMTGRMLEAIEAVLVGEAPDWVLVYGDTNSTLAGALAAVKLHIPLAHVEAGLRSFNMRMPEEVNRIVADRLSTLLFCPTDEAVRNLAAEGLAAGVHQVGDVMYDVALHYGRVAPGSEALARFGVEAGRFVLSTCHRAENTDDEARLAGILAGLGRIAATMPVVLAIHPRTRQRIAALGWQDRLAGVTVVEPLPFLQMVALERDAAAVVTDSGGVQKEAYFHGRPCITMRDETEWVETVAAGWNVLVGADPDRIAAAFAGIDAMAARPRPLLYGDGDASGRIVRRLAG